MKQLLPWATSAGSLLGMWLVSQKRSVGWIVGLVNQVLWVTFAIVYGAWGLLPLTLALIVIYTRALVKWRADERTMKPCVPVECPPFEETVIEHTWIVPGVENA